MTPRLHLRYTETSTGRRTSGTYDGLGFSMVGHVSAEQRVATIEAYRRAAQ